MRTALPALSLLALLASFGSAEKDSDYYYPGFTNPNTKRAMYWKDSINVLQDLEQFEALYVTYHHCVWSNYGQRYGSGEDYDEQGGDNQDDDSSAGCGGYGGEYFWYMGRTQCFKANVAYSLYGILKGEEVPENACRKSTYINSFFTTYGVESFTGPLGLDADTASSQCTAAEPDYAYIDDDSVTADDDYLDDNFQLYDYPSYTSYGTGCSAKRTFVTESYQGAFCRGRDYLETTDTLDDFNDAMSGVECMQIYSSSSYQERRTEEDGSDFAEMDTIDILTYSQSCNIRQDPRDCPDPYGLKKKYSKALRGALTFGHLMGMGGVIGVIVVQALTLMSLAGGVLFLVLAFLLSDKKKKPKWVKSLKRKKSKRKSRGSKSNGSRRWFRGKFSNRSVHRSKSRDRSVHRFKSRDRSVQRSKSRDRSVHRSKSRDKG